MIIVKFRSICKWFLSNANYFSLLSCEIPLETKAHANCLFEAVLSTNLHKTATLYRMSKSYLGYQHALSSLIHATPWKAQRQTVVTLCRINQVNNYYGIHLFQNTSYLKL